MKILRGYLVFILLITAASALTYTNAGKLYFASVLHSSKESLADAKSLSPLFSIKSSFVKNADNFVDKKENEADVIFFITQNAENSFTAPGLKNAEIMKINFKTGKTATEIKNLKFKISGAVDDVENGYINVNGNNVKGRKNDGYLTFAGVGIQLPADSNMFFPVFVDLSGEAKTGNRVRLDIETPEDILISAGGNFHQISGFYPIEGKYLTISRPRPAASPKWSLPEKKE